MADLYRPRPRMKRAVPIVRRGVGRARAGNFRPGNFVATIPLSMAGITDLRVKRGTSAQLQHRRIQARAKFGRR